MSSIKKHSEIINQRTVIHKKLSIINESTINILKIIFPWNDSRKDLNRVSLKTLIVCQTQNCTFSIIFVYFVYILMWFSFSKCFYWLFSILSKSGFEINKTCFMKKDIWHGCNLKVFCPNQINRIWLNHLHDDSY